MQSVEPQVMQIQSVEPQVMQIESTGPQVMQIESTGPQVMQVQSVEPQMMQVQSLDSQVMQVEGHEPQVMQIESTGPKVMQGLQVQTLGPQVAQANALQTATITEAKPKMIQPKFRNRKQRKQGVYSMMSSNHKGGENSPGGGEGVQFDLPTDSPGGWGKDGDKTKKRSQKLKEQAQKSPEKRSSVYSAVRRFHEDKNFMALTK